MVAPVIPAINDPDIERILDAAAAAGVKGAGYVLLRLPLEVRDLFREWLMEHFPDRYRHVFGLIRQMRGGKDYDSTFGKRMTGSGPYAWMIGRRFETACERLGLNVRKAQAHHRAFRAAAAARRTAQPVLNAPAVGRRAVDADRTLRVGIAFYERSASRELRATGRRCVLRTGATVLALYPGKLRRAAPCRAADRGVPGVELRRPRSTRSRTRSLRRTLKPARPTMAAMPAFRRSRRPCLGGGDGAGLTATAADCGAGMRSRVARARAHMRHESHAPHPPAARRGADPPDVPARARRSSAACGRSPAATRPVAARSPARWWRRR